MRFREYFPYFSVINILLLSFISGEVLMDVATATMWVQSCLQLRTFADVDSKNIMKLFHALLEYASGMSLAI